MADDQNKNKSTPSTPNASAPASPTPSSAGSAQSGSTTGGTTSGASTGAASTAGTGAAGAGTPAANVGATNKGGSAASASSAPGAGGTAGSASGSGTSGAATPGSAAGTGSAAPRPVTTTPASGSPFTDRLSLEPERPASGLDRAKAWVEENPALAVLGAVALGLVIGRAVVAALPEPEPKTLTGKIEKRAKVLAEHGRYYADDAGDVIAKQLGVASEALGEAAKVVAKNAKHGYKEAKDFSESVAEALGQAFSKKASEWLEKMS